MSNVEKLTRPAYAPGNSGVVLSVQGQEMQSGRMVMRVVRYDLTIIDSNYKRFARRFFNYAGSLFNHFLAGNSAARSPVSQGAHRQYQPFADKVQVNPQAYTVAYSDTNRPYQPEAVGFASEAMAREYLRGKLAGDPNLADVLQVIPQYEVNQ